MSDRPLIDGVEVVLGGRTLVLPPLNAKTARKFWDRMQSMQAGREDDPMGLTVELVTAALRRNYPEIEQDWVEEMVDLGNMSELSVKINGRGAWQKWCELQAQESAGKATAAAPAAMPSAGTGAPPTPTSPQP